MGEKYLEEVPQGLEGDAPSCQGKESMAPEQGVAVSIAPVVRQETERYAGRVGGISHKAHPLVTHFH